MRPSPCRGLLRDLGRGVEEPTLLFFVLRKSQEARKWIHNASSPFEWNKKKQ